MVPPVLQLICFFFFFLSQCLLRSPVYPYSSAGAGDLAACVAEHAQSVQDQRHLLLLLRHGAVHQRPRHAERDAEGQCRDQPERQRTLSQMCLLYVYS